MLLGRAKGPFAYQPAGLMEEGGLLSRIIPGGAFRVGEGRQTTLPSWRDGRMGREERATLVFDLEETSLEE